MSDPTTWGLSLPAEAESLPLVEVVDRAAAAAAELPAELAQRGEAQAQALATVLRRQVGMEERARKLTAISLVLARRVGAALGPARRGRPVGDLPLPELDATARKRYRLCLEPTEAEFRGWVQTAPSLSRHALINLGRRLRKQRDRDTGEPLPSGDTPSPKPEVPPEGDPPAHRARVWAGSLARILELLRELVGDVSDAPEHVQRTAGEVLLLAEKALALLQTITPSEPTA